jgi:prephenate dehydrogenase
MTKASIVFCLGLLFACSVNLEAKERPTIAIGSRNPESDKAKSLIKATGNNARVESQADAAAASEVVILAVSWPAMEAVAKNLDLDGKVTERLLSTSRLPGNRGKTDTRKLRFPAPVVL